MSKEFKPYYFERVKYARGLSYYDHLLMEEMVEACHKLFERKLPTWDQMYMLKVLSYGELQKIYKDKINEADRFISRAHI
jgi:hypothetical protein